MTASMDPALVEARKMYFEECSDLLSDAAERLAGVADTLGETDPEEINAIFRAVHSAKGGGGAWGLKELAAFAHSYESLLGAIREGAVALTDEVTDALIEANDILVTLLQNAEQDIESSELGWEDFAARLKAIVADSVGSSIPHGAPEHGGSEPAPRIELPSIFDNATAPNVRDELLGAMASADRLDVVADKVERVTTLGIQVLLSAKKQMDTAGGTFNLIDPSPLLQESLTALGCDDLNSEEHG